MNRDPRLRFRIWVDAHLVDEVWLNLRDREAMLMVEQVWHRHQKIISHAEANDERWLIEIYDPDKPEDQALRFGTDEAGIKAPVRDIGGLVRRMFSDSVG